MKIQSLSDLHIERQKFSRIDIPETSADVIVLAGDIGLGYNMEANFCKKMAQDHGKPVVFVLGNHSYYEWDYAEVRQKWYNEAEALKEEGVHFIDDGIIWTYEDTMFCGGTLWTDFDGDEEAMRYAERRMNDFHVVRNSAAARNFLPKDSVMEHESTLDYIGTVLHHNRADKNVVVTHHMPSYKSVDDQYKGDMLNAAFASDLDDFIATHNIDVWIHGHTHSSCDYMLEDTRIVCNPYGYHNYAVNGDFEEDMVIEI